MKRTIFLLMSILLLLTACGDGHKQTSSDKEQSEHKDNHNKNQVKQIATDKKFKVITIGLYCPLKKARLVDYYKIIWQMVIMEKILKVVY